MNASLIELNFKISERKREQGNTCCAYGCCSPAVSKKNNMCHKHYRRHRKCIDPVYDRYNSFKSGATKRCKVFTITLEEFRGFCERTGYIIQKGKRGKSYSVDRINNEFGYHIWNIQLITLRRNIYKYHHEDRGVHEYSELPY